jgi:sugar transferase (PEP-CTERM/EpsH1 system associated)
VLRALKPDIVHTRNLPALECQFVAALAGVKARVHGEHGRDVYDPDGNKFKYNALRKGMRVFVNHYVAVSRDLAHWLKDTIGVPPQRVSQIYNGVDAKIFHPRRAYPQPVGPAGFSAPSSFVIGTVGRMEPIKGQLTLVQAFLRVLDQNPGWRERLRLVIVGDGSLREKALKMIREAQAEELAWLPGERDDVAEIMRGLDLFVLPSLREGISNTILEAMASGVPVVATKVGGNPELLEQDTTGMLVPYSEPVSMASAISSYVADVNKATAHGRASRGRIESHFTMAAMVAQYINVYDSVLHRTSVHTTGSRSSSRGLSSRLAVNRCNAS